MALGGMSSSGFGDDIDATVVKSRFVVDEQYNPDTLTLDWTIKDDNADTEYSLKFAMGTKSGFYAIDGGRYAKSVKHDQPVKGTVYSSLCTYCIEKLAMMDELKTRFTDIEDGGVEFLDAEGWVGLQFHFQLQKPADIGLEYKRLDERANKDRLWPVKFLGSSATIKPNLNVKNAHDTEKEDAEQAALIAKLHDIARNSENFDQFIMAAIGVEGLHKHPKLQQRIADPYDFFPEHKI